MDAELVSLLDVFRDGDRLDELGGRMLVRQAFAEAGVLLPVGSSIDKALASDGEREGAKVVAERGDDGQVSMRRENENRGGGLHHEVRRAGSRLSDDRLAKPGVVGEQLRQTSAGRHKGKDASEILEDCR